MSTYMRTPEMMSGGPFKCFNCGKLMIRKVMGGPFKIQLECRGCKSVVTLEMKQAAPWAINDGKVENVVKNVA